MANILPLCQQHPQSKDPQRSHRKASTLPRLTALRSATQNTKARHNDNVIGIKRVLTITYTQDSLMLTYVLCFIYVLFRRCSPVFLHHLIFVSTCRCAGFGTANLCCLECLSGGMLDAVAKTQRTGNLHHLSC